MRTCLIHKRCALNVLETSLDEVDQRAGSDSGSEHVAKPVGLALELERVGGVLKSCRTESLSTEDRIEGEGKIKKIRRMQGSFNHKRQSGMGRTDLTLVGIWWLFAQMLVGFDE